MSDMPKEIWVSLEDRTLAAGTYCDIADHGFKYRRADTGIDKVFDQMQTEIEMLEATLFGTWAANVIALILFVIAFIF